MGGIMKYAVEIGSSVMTHKIISIKVGSGIQKLIREVHREKGNIICLLEESGGTR
jgi:hypothetical protein